MPGLHFSGNTYRRLCRVNLWLWMLEEGYDSVAILYENSDYGLGLKDVVQKAFTAAGGQVVGIETYYLGETKDFSSIITKIRATSPEAVFVAGLYNEAAHLQQSKAVGWEPAFFGVDAYTKSPST